MAEEPLTETDTNPPSWLVEKREKAISDCSVFYNSGGKRGFPWECGDGWNDVLARMSYSIEALNTVFGEKYGVICEAHQIKEKFGTLCVYTQVTVRPSFLKRTALSVVTAAIRLFDRFKLDHAMKKIVDSPRHFVYDYTQLPKDEYEKAQKNQIKCVNEEYIESDGRFYRIMRTESVERTHYEPSRHVFLYKVRKALERQKYAFVYSPSKPNRKQRVIMQFMDSKVSEYADAAEKECYNRCESCGTEIGTSYSPRCETHGWISYVCEKCAKRGGRSYVKDGVVCDDRQKEQDA